MKTKDPTTEVEEAPEKPADIKAFKPIKNSRLKDALMTDDELARSKVDEPPATIDPKPVPKAEEEDDFVLPSSDDPFGIDGPMIDLIKPDAKPAAPVLEDTSISDKKEANKGLRDELRASQERLRESDRSGQAKLQGLTDEIAALKTQLSETNSRLAYRNPDEHPEVLAITKPWDDELASMSKEMTLMGGDGERLKALVPELIHNFEAIDGADNAADHQVRQEQLIGMIDENFPEDKREVLRLISRGSDILKKANIKVEEVRSGGETFEVGRATEQYDALVSDYDALEKTYFNPSKELRDADPLNQKVLLKDLIDSDERIADKANRIKSFVRFAMTPLPLPNQSDIGGMDEDAAAQFLQKRTAEHLGARKKISNMMAEALMSHAMFPVLAKNFAEHKELLEQYKRAQPELRVENNHQKPPLEDDQPRDIKEFQPKRANLRFD